MAPQREEDWSDSDEEPPVGVETSVLLGIPDGPVTSPEDIRDAAVSRIGGHPALIPFNEPPFSSSHCKNCSNPMELLVQLWCPFENSVMDRALYAWGCARRTCQRKDGSVRAWRGLRLNTEYSLQLAPKKAIKQAARDVTKIERGSNPFAMQPSQPTAIGLGSQIFGDRQDMILSPVWGNKPDDTENNRANTPDNCALVTAMASVVIENSGWASAPSYSAVYLSSMAEHLPLPTNDKLPDARVADPVEGNHKSWAFESYENSLRIDRVFENFSRRVGYQGEQCVRYELNGTPLTFSSDKIFDQLFPEPTLAMVPVTRAGFTVLPPVVRSYRPMSVPSCPFCHSKRVFECQLMPNLINILARERNDRIKKPMTHQERMKEIGKTLQGGTDGMEWGTCIIFSCENDCSDNDGCWREEVVLVQWDV